TNDAADREIACADGNLPVSIGGHRTRTEVQIFGASKCEIGIPVLGVVVGQCDCGGGCVIDCAGPADGECTAAQGRGVVNVQLACRERCGAAVSVRSTQ